VLGGDARRGDYSYLGAPPRKSPITAVIGAIRMAPRTTGSPLGSTPVQGHLGTPVQGYLQGARRPATAAPSTHQTKGNASVPATRGVSARPSDTGVQAQTYTLNLEP